MKYKYKYQIYKENKKMVKTNLTDKIKSASKALPLAIGLAMSPQQSQGATAPYIFPLDLNFTTGTATMSFENTSPATIDSVDVDLSNYNLDNTWFDVGWGALYNETGNTTDNYFSFSPISSFAEVSPNGFLGGGIGFNTYNPLSPIYGLDLTTLPTISIENFLTAYSGGELVGAADANIPDINTYLASQQENNNGTVPAPRTLGLLLAGALAYAGAKKFNNKKVEKKEN